ncbi:MAG: hypothetical protein QM731_27770 [Chitinophagaceae bacterium]
MSANVNGYRSIPMKSEEKKSAIYASGAFTTGGANEDLRDGFSAGLVTVHQSHNFGPFQGYYGVMGMLGRYKVDDYGTQSSTERYRNSNLDVPLINSMAGRKTFGSWGAVGGLNAVVPFGRKHEWRILGAEFSWNREFGDYLDFRTKLPDSAANIIDRNRDHMSIAITSDLVFHLRNGSVGYKASVALGTRRLTEYDKDRARSRYQPGCVSNTFHITIQKFTGFWQFNVGDHSLGMQLGLNYRLGRY